MNTGEEPFKCGMESAECGVRRNLISVIAKLRAPSRRVPLPLRHSECGVRSVLIRRRFRRRRTLARQGTLARQARLSRLRVRPFRRSCV